ncbi:MAG: cytochrome c3 family protein [Acidobacteriia bacterium]|nr:cytochrome c3 family protein [Terriglobia bacterium]
MNRGLLFFAAGLLAALGIGWMGFPRMLYERIDQPLQFSHRVHTSEKVGLKCDDCHAFRSDGSFAGIPSVSKCAECHAAPLTASADEKLLVEKYIVPGEEIPWRVYSRQPDNTYFSHLFHVRQARLKCDECHGSHGSSESLREFQRNRLSGYSRDIWGQNIAGFSRGMKMTECSRCHAARGRSDACLDCHK